MALRAVKPTITEKRLKALFYGTEGSGKTTAAISFPKPYIIDTEKGSVNDQYVRKINERGGVVFHTNNFYELRNEVISLLSEKHDYKTLVIDPLTTIFNDLVEQSESEHGTEFGRHYVVANKQMKSFMNLLSRLDMNVIITSHAKTEYQIAGKSMTVLGTTFDCYKKLGYIFDMMFEVQKRGSEHIGIIRKSRVEMFPCGETFPFNYDEIAQRYGREILERDAVPEVLATKQQVSRLNELVELYKEPQEVVQKWLDKANAECFSEMNEDIINKLIVHMESKSQPHQQPGRSK